MTKEMPEWYCRMNSRRHELIHKKIEGELNEEEQREFEMAQAAVGAAVHAGEPRGGLAAIEHMTNKLAKFKDGKKVCPTCNGSSKIVCPTCKKDTLVDIDVEDASEQFIEVLEEVYENRAE